MPTHLHTAADEPLVNAFLAELDVRPNSRSTYQRMLRAFTRWRTAQGLNLQDIQRADILRFREELLAQGRSELTVSGYLTVVRRFYAWAAVQEVLPDVAHAVKGPKKDKRFRRSALTPEEVKRLLRQLPQTTTAERRDYALVSLLVHTGLRTIEAQRARLKHIVQRHGQRVLRVQGKGRDGADQIVLVPDTCYQALEQYWAARAADGQATGPESPVFASLSARNYGQALTTRRISGLCKAAFAAVGLSDPLLSAHSLRHTAGVTALRNGADLYATQLFLRHRDPATTEQYLRTLEEAHRLKHAPEHGLAEAFAIKPS